MICKTCKYFSDAIEFRCAVNPRGPVDDQCEDFTKNVFQGVVSDFIAIPIPQGVSDSQVKEYAAKVLGRYISE